MHIAALFGFEIPTEIFPSQSNRWRDSNHLDWDYGTNGNQWSSLGSM